MGSASVPVSTDAFKSAMRRFATGVTIVTTAHNDAIHGFTVNAFASVTADPPTVLVCVNKNARAHPLISESGGFCVNILGIEQQAIAETFTTAEPQSRFNGLAHRRGPTGSPVLDGVLAYVDCKVEEEMTAGTHTIFIGRVVEVGDREGARSATSTAHTGTSISARDRRDVSPSARWRVTVRSSAIPRAAKRSSSTAATTSQRSRTGSPGTGCAPGTCCTPTRTSITSVRWARCASAAAAMRCCTRRTDPLRNPRRTSTLAGARRRRGGPLDGDLAEGDRFAIGGVALEVLHTPGHTPGSTSFALAHAGATTLFTGDTLFRGAVGRWDLGGTSLEDIVASIRAKLLVYADTTGVVPGHGPTTTIGTERATNPFLL